MFWYFRRSKRLHFLGLSRSIWRCCNLWLPCDKEQRTISEIVLHLGKLLSQTILIGQLGQYTEVEASVNIKLIIIRFYENIFSFHHSVNPFSSLEIITHINFGLNNVSANTAIQSSAILNSYDSLIKQYLKTLNVILKEILIPCQWLEEKGVRARKNYRQDGHN